MILVASVLTACLKYFQLLQILQQKQQLQK